MSVWLVGVKMDRGDFSTLRRLVSLGRGLLNAIGFNWIVVIICSFTLKFLVNQLGNGVGF